MIRFWTSIKGYQIKHQLIFQRSKVSIKGIFLRKSMVPQVALKYFQSPITRVLRLVARNLFPTLYSPFKFSFRWYKFDIEIKKFTQPIWWRTRSEVIQFDVLRQTKTSVKFPGLKSKYIWQVRSRNEKKCKRYVNAA